jgi:hypothetical protein
MSHPRRVSSVKENVQVAISSQESGLPLPVSFRPTAKVKALLDELDERGMKRAFMINKVLCEHLPTYLAG